MFKSAVVARVDIVVQDLISDTFSINVLRLARYIQHYQCFLIISIYNIIRAALL